MQKRSKWRICSLLAIIFSMTMIGSLFCEASENTEFDTSGGEVVFLLDTSVSMNGQDHGKFAVDAIRQAVYSLPSSYKAGLVAYNTEIQMVIPFRAERSEWDAQLETIEYFGYTNAGEALKQAMEMFSGEEGMNRYVVILSDGEIDMPDGQQREDSRLLYEEMVKEAADRGIILYIIASGSEWNGTKAHIFDGAELTNGSIYWEGQSGSISEIMNRILYSRMNFPRSAIASIEVEEGNGGIINVELPSMGADHVRIILTAEQGIQGIHADYSAREGTMVQGEKFAVVDMVRPVGQNIEISYEAVDPSGIEAYMIAEYAAEIKTQVTYRTEAEEDLTAQQRKEDNSPVTYTHFADIEISLADEDGQNDNLWNSAYYEGREIPITINETSIMGKIHNGTIICSMQIDGIEEAALTVDVSRLSECFIIRQPEILTFSPPADPIPETEPETNYLPLCVIMGVLLLALSVLVIVWTRKNKTTVIYMAESAGKEGKKEEIKGCDYNGKLNMYVIRTPTGKDIPPQTYRLFGRQNIRITLSQVLNSCGIRLEKIGAEEIIFYPGQERSLIVMDQSEKCTVLRGTEILKKGMGYPVYYHEKITVIFDDEATEMEIHYKNLKPSEQ